MSLIDQKSKVFGNIAAARVLTEGLPKLITNPSFPSINNNGDSVTFLVDMLKALVGIENLRDIVVDTLVFKLDEMEEDIKTEIKKSLKMLVNCGVDPSIPDNIKTTTAFTAPNKPIKIETNKVDFFDMLKTNPTSREGKLLYTDFLVSPLTSSNDYNTFLYGTVQNDGTTETWENILDIKFDSSNFNPEPNNTLTITSNPSYDNKTLTDLNNDFVDSIDLFDTKVLLNQILDTLFGSISLSLNKTRSQIKKEAEIRYIIECVINADDGAVIDDSFFTFSNEEVADLESGADMRRKGIRVVETCGRAVTSVSMDTIDSVNEELTSAQGGIQMTEAMGNTIKTIGGEIGGQAPDKKDAYALELNFIEGLIDILVSSIVGYILSPKVISIFLINYKIVYGVDEEYVDGADFMRQNKTLVKDVSKAVRNAIINILLTEVLKEITAMVAASAIKIATEKGKNQLAQILSLVGVPQDVLRLIRGL